MSNPTELPDLAEAVRKLVKAKGRFHTEQNYKELADALARYDARSAQPEGEAPQAAAWQPIETAPKTGQTLLLGRLNEMGNWRTMRGQWFTKAEIDQDWEETDGFEAGWYETAVEPDFPNCWEIAPTHWMTMPAAPAATLSPLCGAQHAESGEEDELCFEHPAFLEIMNDVLTPEGWVKFKNDEMVRLNSESIIDIFKAGLAAQLDGGQEGSGS